MQAEYFIDLCLLCNLSFTLVQPSSSSFHAITILLRRHKNASKSDWLGRPKPHGELTGTFSRFPCQFKNNGKEKNIFLSFKIPTVVLLTNVSGNENKDQFEKSDQFHNSIVSFV